MITFRLNGKILDKVYILRGEPSSARWNYTLRPRYIQVSNGVPGIVTSVGYRSSDVVLFTSKKEAEEFRMKFLSSNRRRFFPGVTERIIWMVKEYRPKDIGLYEKPDQIIDLCKVNDHEYGTYYFKSKIEYYNRNKNNNIYNPFVYNESIDVIIENNDLAYKLLDLIDSEVIIKYVKEHYSAYDLIDIDWSID